MPSHKKEAAAGHKKNDGDSKEQDGKQKSARAQKKQQVAQQRERDRQAQAIGELLQAQKQEVKDKEPTELSTDSEVVEDIWKLVGDTGTFIPDDVIMKSAEILETFNKENGSTFYINNFPPSVQQVYMHDNGEEMEHKYLEEDKPTINFLLIDHHWLTVVFQPGKESTITIYDSLATKKRTVSVLPLLQKMYPNITIESIIYIPITQQGEDPACGAYAVASAIACLRGSEAEQKQFDCSKMREHLKKILRERKPLSFPTTGLRCINCRPWQAACKHHLFEVTFKIVSGSAKGDNEFKKYITHVACGVINGKTDGQIRIKNLDYDESSKLQGTDEFMQQIEPAFKELSSQAKRSYSEVFSKMEWEDGHFKYFLIDIKGCNALCCVDTNIYEACHSSVDRIKKADISLPTNPLSAYKPEPQLSKNNRFVLNDILQDGENVNRQYKYYKPDQKDLNVTDQALINKLTDKSSGLRKYVSAFTRQSTVRSGGNFFAGINELREKERNKDSNKTFDETKGTVYIVNGQIIEKWENIEKGLTRIICEKMCWLTSEGNVLGNEDIKKYYETVFHPVYSEDKQKTGKYVIEVAVAYFDGYVFTSKDGPEVPYIAQDGSLMKMTVKEWYNAFRKEEPLQVLQQTLAQGLEKGYRGSAANVDLGEKEAAQTIPKQSSIESEMRTFLTAVNDFKYDHLILVADHIEPTVNLQSLGLVPWTFIFDFDPKSRARGMLSQVEMIIKDKRSLHISHWKEKCNINDQSSHWMFLKGMNEQPDTKTDDEFGKWRRQTKSALENITKQLTQFGEQCTNYYVVIVWPNNENIALHVKHLVLELDGMNLCKFIIVRERETNLGASESVLRGLQLEMPSDSQPTIINLGIDDICVAVQRVFSETTSDKINKYALPIHKSVEQTNRHITDQEAQWLTEGLEVLYETPSDTFDNSMKNLTTQTDDFFRGGNWPWPLWYEMGPGHVDVERDIMKDVIKSLRDNYISQHKSGKVTICHAPGSGGTTLAQRILWDLHLMTPCAQVKLRTGHADVKSRVSFLYEKTRRPILLLVDGEDEQRVTMLMNEVKEVCCVILYMKRYPYPMEDKQNSEKRFWLKTFVSKSEATKIAMKYLKQCDNLTSKMKAVQNLQKEVNMDTSDHAIFEFGLAAYNHEYKGIESYVRGFLQFDNFPDCPLLPWQHALVILSLVYYYGQIAMPCKFFSKMLGRDSLMISNLNDLPREMQSLIVKEQNDEGRTTLVRISHYLVAKEVLEQALSRPNIPGDRSRELCDTAKRKLEPFALGFIKIAGETGSAQPSSMMIDIMYHTFIRRDNKYAGETDLFKAKKKRKAKFAQILHDVSSKPPFQERFNIMEELTRAFPREAEFHAHLGRLYSICKPEEEESAATCLKEALGICKESADFRKPVDGMDYAMRLTLMHIYHMYGNIFLNRVKEYSGRYFGDEPKKRLTRERFEIKTRELLEIVVMACDYFSKCREVTPTELNADHGFLGEITIRLMFCDFISRNYKKYMKRNIFDFINQNTDTEISSFVAESIAVIDGLMFDCHTTVDAERTTQELQNHYEWYVSLFRMHKNQRVFQRQSHNIMSRRIQIAARKYLYETKEVYGVLEAVTRREDIQFIVKEYEKIFEEIHDNQGQTSPQAIDRDYKEWLIAVRHHLFDTNYRIEDVLKHVRQWYDEVKTLSSRYYYFVLCSLLGFEGSTYFLIESKQLRQEMLKKSGSKVPREWLGVGHGIRRLLPLLPGKKIDLDSEQLKRRCGTIMSPNTKPKSGYISLDLDEDSDVSVEIFYVPAVSEMMGPSFAGRRVTFCLAFSMAHGYEAYHVKAIEKIRCARCGLFSEPQNNEQIVCTRCRRN